MEITIKVTKAVVVLTAGTDICYIDTDLPEPLWPFDGRLSLRFETAANAGKKYLSEVLKCECVEVINGRPDLVK